MPVQQGLDSVNWGTVIVAVITAIVTAWVSAWVNNRYERGRLMRMWRLRQSKDRLDTVREYVHRYIQDIAVVNAVRSFKDPTADEKAAESEALLDSYRAAVSAAAISQAVGDKEMSTAGLNLQNTIRTILTGAQQEHVALPISAGPLLRRCDDLLEERDESWWKRVFGR